VGGLRVNVAAVKKIAGNEDEINPPPQCVALDDIAPGAKEVAGAIRQIVALDAEVNVCNVKKSGHAKFVYALIILTGRGLELLNFVRLSGAATICGKLKVRNPNTFTRSLCNVRGPHHLVGHLRR